MAAVAARTELAIVDILTTMTVTAKCRRILRFAVRCVTGGTFEPFVFAAERKSGLAVVIKLPHRPGVRRVANRAILSKRALMAVILLMAGDTALILETELVTDMAMLAGHDAVHADQRELTDIVIKLVNPLPALCGVAGTAQCHVRIVVHIIGAVTAGAIARQRIAECTAVTLHTAQILVLAG